MRYVDAIFITMFLVFMIFLSSYVFKQLDNLNHSIDQMVKESVK